MLDAVSQVGNTQSCVQDELPNNSFTIHTALSNNNRTAPRFVRQTCTVHTVLTKNTTRVNSTGEDSGVTEAELKTSRVSTRGNSYQTLETPQKKEKLTNGKKRQKNEKMKK